MVLRRKGGIARQRHGEEIESIAEVKRSNRLQGHSDDLGRAAKQRKRNALNCKGKAWI